MQFEFDPEFLDQLAELIPSAPIRHVFLDHGVVRHASREMASRGRGGEVGILLEDGFGLLITEAGLAGIPELLVSFEYWPVNDPTTVTFYRIRRAPPPYESEDESGPS